MSEGLRAEDVKEALARYDDGERLRGREWAPVLAAARAWLASQEQTPDHAFLPVNGHPDDDECTYRSDGTDDTYCGLPESAHEDDVVAHILLVGNFNPNFEEWEDVRPATPAEVRAGAALVGFHPQPAESPEVPT